MTPSGLSPHFWDLGLGLSGLDCITGYLSSEGFTSSPVGLRDRVDCVAGVDVINWNRNQTKGQSNLAKAASNALHTLHALHSITIAVPKICRRSRN